MTRRTFLTAAGSLVLAAAALSPVHAADKAADPMMLFWQENPTRKIKLDDWNWVEMQKRDGAPANAQPIKVSEAVVGACLRAIRIEQRSHVFAAFEPDEIELLAPAVAFGLGFASPDQDIGFVTTARRSFADAYGARMTNVGRAFVANGKLNILLGLGVSDVLLNQRPNALAFPKLDFGNRATASKQVRMQTPEGASARVVRSDWVSCDLTPVAAAAAQATPAAASASAQPAAVAPVVAPVAAPANPVVDHMRQDADRLRELKKLHEEGLLTDAEFEKKRAEIVKGL